MAIQAATAPKPVQAFDGAGSSAYIGKTTTSKAELNKSYQRRVVADVKDFKRLGEAIQNGETEGDSWVSFFIEFQRREPDSVGRAYAALVDLVGNKELSGCGTLLAASFAKAGKPSEGLPSVKKYNAMAKMFDPIKAAGQKGDLTKAKTAYGKVSAVLRLIVFFMLYNWLSLSHKLVQFHTFQASDAVQAYLEAVELPPMSDALYD